MRLLIICENYPQPHNWPGDMFVHVRAQYYQQQHEVEILTPGVSSSDGTLEGVHFTLFTGPDDLSAKIAAYNPDRIMIHFYKSWMFDAVIQKTKVPITIWVHGYEALGWYRRLFNYKWYSTGIYGYMKVNTIQQLNFRKLIKYANTNTRIQFVFVSKWMRRITEFDTMSKIKRAYIIPNPINTEVFKYREKKAEDRNKILMIRSFASRKYANDISVEAIKILSGKPFFKDLSIKILGDGQLFDALTEPLKQYANVSVERKFLTQAEVSEMQNGYGVFLCPTRQDAQGVSMCEAMSSGLVPVSSFNTAIPEFVENMHDGILTHNASEVAAAIAKLHEDAELFKRLSKNASVSIKEKCEVSRVSARELEVVINNHL